MNCYLASGSSCCQIHIPESIEYTVTMSRQKRNSLLQTKDTMMSKPRRNSLLQMIPFFEQVVQPTRVEMTKEAVRFCIKKKEELENPDRVERLYLHNKVTLTVAYLS